VVNAEHAQPVVVPSLARVHTIAVPAIAALSLLLPAFTTRLVEQEMWAPLMHAYERVNADPMVLHAQVNRGFTARGDKRTTYLQITAYLSEPRIDEWEIAQRLARYAIQADPSSMNLDVVQVVLVYGYDIGIATGHRSYAHDKTAAEWLQ
jgi:hypothetical protein